MSTPLAIELLLVPRCPHADAARTLLDDCLHELPLDVRRAATVVERVGDFPSPTILINGRDVMSGDEVTAGVSACRLDLPTGARLRRALHDAIRVGEHRGTVSR